jgi:hypothetical protein
LSVGGGAPLNFGAINVVLLNILGEADGLTIFLHNYTVNQATVDLPTVSGDDNDRCYRFWSVGATVVPAVVLQDIGDKCPFGFVGISGAATGPTVGSCKGIVNCISW